MIYYILKSLARIATKQFFREIRIAGHEPLEDAPLLIVANHPNVMMDGLIVMRLFQRPIWIIAKATIFKGAHVNWFLNLCHFVPVHRRQDSDDDAVNNEEAFRYVSEALRDKRAVLIFPEGQSKAMRKILPVRTGAARIALQCESEADFQVGLKIQPVGMTYADFQRFNSSVTVTVGEPISVADYASMYKINPQNAVRDLSAQIEDELQHTTAHIEREENVPLIEKIAKLYRSRTQGIDDKRRLEVVAKNVERLISRYPEQAKSIEKRITRYLQLASSLKLDGSEELDLNLNEVFLFLISPFVLLGIALSFIPYRFIGWLGKRAAAGKRSQTASWMLSIGFFFFPLWYAFLAGILGWFFEDWSVGGVSLLVFLFCGYCVSWHLNAVALFFFSTFWPGRRTPLDVLRAMRDDLIDELEQFRKVPKPRVEE